MERESFKTAKLPIFTAINNKVDDIDNGTNVPTIINGVLERLQDPFSGNQVAYVTQRPSFKVYSTLTNSTAIFYHAHYPYICLGTTIYKQVLGSSQTTVWSGTNTTADNGSRFTLLRDSVNNVDLLAFVEGGTGKLVTINMSTDVATVQTSAPTNINPFIAYMNGYTFVNKLNTDEIYNSDVNDVTTWNLGVNFIKSSSKPGYITALVNYKNYIIAFKDTSCEFFYDAALSGTSPLQRNENIGISIGCPFPWTIAQSSDKIFFAGRSEVGNSTCIYTMSGESLEKISTSAIDRLLKDNSNIANGRLNRYYGSACVAKLTGNTYYILGLNKNLTLAYCLESKEWSTWVVHALSDYVVYDISSLGSPLGALTDAPVFFLANATSTKFAVFTTTQQSYDVIDDVNKAIIISVTTPQIDFGTVKRKIISCMRWLGTLVTGKNVRCFWSDDNQTTLSNKHVFPIGTNPTIRNLGQFRRREFTFEFVNVQDINTPNTESTTILPRIRMEGIEVEYREGTN